MEIIKASILDLNMLRKLEQESFSKDAWPLFDLIAVLTFPDVIRLKAMEDGQMVGFVGGDPRPHDGWGWIATIAVDPHYRRRGIGSALLHACESKLGVPFDGADIKSGCHCNVRKRRLHHDRYLESLLQRW
jgi:ribosomal protein S18 acetylase RimI-like enzyme